MICCVITSIVAKLCRMHSLTEAWRDVGIVLQLPGLVLPRTPACCAAGWVLGQRAAGDVGWGTWGQGLQRVGRREDRPCMYLPSLSFHPGQHSCSSWTRLGTGRWPRARCVPQVWWLPTDKTFSVPCHGCHPSEFKAKDLLVKKKRKRKKS